MGNNRERLDFGPLVILQHQTSHGDVFYTLYGHLKLSSIEHLHVGQLVKQGEIIARIGYPPENGDWPPHVHFQIITDLLDLDNLFPGVVSSETQNVWLSLCPDPNLILDIPDECFPPTIYSPEETLIKRRIYTGRNLSLSYQKPLKIVRGWMQFLYDDTGRAYLDMYNNVPHVGHSHPHIVKAIQDQAALLNTNTRYLHDNLIHYAERLVGYMPDSLEVCYFLNSASEANELALRLARTYTQQEDVIVLENAYHGHTSTLIDISPYKFNGPGGSGNKPWVHVALMPDDYRGRFRRDDPDRGHKFALFVKEIIGQLEKSGTGLAAFIAETFPSVGGQIIPPPGYLKAAYHFVHEYGGVCIADEVQVGLGRLGQCFWGFQSQNVVPDIVVLGKPIGNGHPLAAVVTRREIADAFDNGMEFFSTFGGNPVSCAAGLAVLDVLERDNLPANAERVGNYLKEQLTEMMKVFPVIGDVRGMGLFMGIELIQDQSTLEPAPRQATYIVNRLRDEGILVGTDGPFHNVIKMRPPLIFSEDDANLFLDKFRNILDEDGAKCG